MPAGYTSFKTKIAGTGSNLLNRAREKLQAAGKAAKPTMDGIHKEVASGLEELKKAPVHSKIGLALGATGLGISINNARSLKTSREADRKRLELEHKSVSALSKIEQALTRHENNSQ